MKTKPHPIDKRIGEKLRECRLAKGYSQSNVAEQLDITFQQVQKYENGKNRISARSLNEIALYLDVPVGYFFER